MIATYIDNQYATQGLNLVNHLFFYELGVNQCILSRWDLCVMAHITIIESFCLIFKSCFSLILIPVVMMPFPERLDVYHVHLQCLT